MKSRQPDFFDHHRDFAPRRHTHGGPQAKGQRKLARPLDPQKPVHLILKSSHARGNLSLLGAHNQLVVAKIVEKWAAKFHVKIHGLENMGNHLHIVASFPKREFFQDFLRTITAMIARAVTGSRRGKPFGKRFWDRMAFTRVITGARDQRGMNNYLNKNAAERDFGPLSRKTIEQYEAATREARRKGVDIWRILERLGPTT